METAFRTLCGGLTRAGRISHTFLGLNISIIKTDPAPALAPVGSEPSIIIAYRSLAVTQTTLQTYLLHLTGSQQLLGFDIVLSFCHFGICQERIQA